MRDGSIGTDLAGAAVVLTCCLRMWQLFARGKHRIGAIESLIKAPAYRVLFVLVLIGMLLIGMLPEAAFVLPVLDALGLDIMTLLVALELRHYVASMARLLGLPTSVDAYLRVPARVVRRRAGVLLKNPLLGLYACMWPVIWIRVLMGRMTPV